MRVQEAPYQTQSENDNKSYCNNFEKSFRDLNTFLQIPKVEHTHLIEMIYHVNIDHEQKHTKECINYDDGLFNIFTYLQIVVIKNKKVNHEDNKCHKAIYAEHSLLRLVLFIQFFNHVINVRVLGIDLVLHSLKLVQELVHQDYEDLHDHLLHSLDEIEIIMPFHNIPRLNFLPLPKREINMSAKRDHQQQFVRYQNESERSGQHLVVAIANEDEHQRVERQGRDAYDREADHVDAVVLDHFQEVRGVILSFLESCFDT